MKWDKGRQGTGYLKKRIFECKLWIRNAVLDCYLLRYPTGTEVPPHVDDLGFWKHWRLNIVLRKAKKGGEFYYFGEVWTWWRINLFRPDEVEHWVTEVEEGERWVLSIGLAYT